jgi:hypothetical protein
MGEAKRRKKLDPDYGIYNPQISIAESPNTQNFLVMVDRHCVDSTIHLEEAEAIKAWIETEHRLNPMKRQDVKAGHLNAWMVKSPRHENYPTTTAEIIVFNTQTGEMETQLFTI